MTKEEARAKALGALYAADVLHADDIDASGLGARPARLALGPWEPRASLDSAIDEASTRWRIDRMPAVDRNILRLGAYELLHTDVPTGVAISEAVELAKHYSTGKSGAFVNGILSAIADDGRQSTRV